MSIITWEHYRRSSQYTENGSCSLEWKSLFGEVGMKVEVESVRAWMETMFGGIWSFERLLPTYEKKREFRNVYVMNTQGKATDRDVAEAFVRLYGAKKQSLVDKIVQQAKL